jgi:signal peptidase I
VRVWLALVLLAAAPMLMGADIPLATYIVPAHSMEPTLDQGDIIGLDRPSGQCGRARPKLGDVVIFRRPPDSVTFVARVVAGEGQSVEVRIGRLFLEGRPVETTALGRQDVEGTGGGTAAVLRERLPNGASYLTWDLGPHGKLDNYGPSRVPKDEWFVMGDNRDNAADSRLRGPVPDADICAVANVVIVAKDKSHFGRKP